MKSVVRKITIRFIAVLMIAAIGMLVVNHSLFFHFHQLADGSIVAHSHPYTKSAENSQKGDNNHHHTQLQLMFLQALELLFLLTFLTAATILGARKIFFFINFNRNFTSPVTLPFKGRAPPALITDMFDN
jgi:hypothetical protein